MLVYHGYGNSRRLGGRAKRTGDRGDIALNGRVGNISVKLGWTWDIRETSDDEDAAGSRGFAG